MATTVDRHNAFISCHNKNAEQAKSIVKNLKERNLQIFYPEEDLDPLGIITEELKNGIQNSEYMIILISKEWMESTWVHFESYWAELKCKQYGGKSIVPVLIDPDVKGDPAWHFMRLCHEVDPLIFTDTEDFYKRLCDKITGIKRFVQRIFYSEFICSVIMHTPW